MIYDVTLKIASDYPAAVKDARHVLRIRLPRLAPELDDHVQQQRLDEHEHDRAQQEQSLMQPRDVRVELGVVSEDRVRVLTAAARSQYEQCRTR